MKPSSASDKISGNLILGKDSIIKDGATINGPIIIGNNCVIDNDVRIGQFTSIGDNSQLSKCDIENSIVMSNCCIKANKKIRNSIISYNSSIIQNDNNNDEMIFLLGEGTKITLWFLKLLLQLQHCFHDLVKFLKNIFYFL